MSMDAKWHANWIRLLPASSADEKMRNLEAADLLEWLESQVPRWIPVEDTEHKPMHGKDYLCVCTLKDYPDERWLQVLRWYADENGNGYVQRPHFTDEGCCGMLVTHWSEKPELPSLPEAPKEDAE